MRLAFSLFFSVFLSLFFPLYFFSVARMLRQRIGAMVKIRGTVFFPLAAGGITFSCYEKGEPRAVCYSGCDRRYLFIPKQAHLTKQSASPFPTLALSRPDAAYLLSSCAFRTCLYLSIRLYVSLFPPTYLFRGHRISFFPATSRTPHACLRFSFIKLIASTKPKKHVVWGVTREYRVASTETSTARDSRWAMPSIGLTGHRYAPLWHSIGESLETVWIMWFVWWMYSFFCIGEYTCIACEISKLFFSLTFMLNCINYAWILYFDLQLYNITCII